MKKRLLTLLAVAALLMCGCEKEDNNNNNNNDPEEPTIDVTPYLGSYLMARHTELTLSVMDLLTFPLDRDLDVEIVTVKTDPTVEHGIIMSSTDGMYLRGVVDTLGLRLQNDTITFAIDTTVGSIPLNTSLTVSLTHPVIAPPVNGVMDWTSIANGTGSVQVPILGNLTLGVTGDMRYHSVIR